MVPGSATLLSGAKPRCFGPPPLTRVLLLFLRLFVSGLSSGREKLGASFRPFFSLLSSDLSTDVGIEYDHVRT